MPIEIRELQITGIVQENDSKTSTPSMDSANNATNNQTIIAACVEQVLEILKQKNER